MTKTIDRVLTIVTILAIYTVVAILMYLAGPIMNVASRMIEGMRI